MNNRNASTGSPALTALITAAAKQIARNATACVIAAAGCIAPALADDRTEMLADKASFLRTVDGSITGDLIAARPFKYVGKHVGLNCVVQGTNYLDFFDAACPKGHVAIDAPGYSRAVIKPGASVRIFGIVERPWGASRMDSEIFSVVDARILMTRTRMMERGLLHPRQPDHDSHRAGIDD